MDKEKKGLKYKNFLNTNIIVKKFHILRGFLVIVFLILTLVTYQMIFSDKFFPGVYIGDINLTFLTKQQANQLIQSKINQRLNQDLTFVYEGQNYTVNFQSSAKIDYQSAIDEAFLVGHQGPTEKLFLDQVKAITGGYVVKPKVELSLNSQTKSISKKINKNAKDASLNLDEINNLKVIPGGVGVFLNEEQLIEAIKNYLIYGQKNELLPTKLTPPNITTLKAQQAKDMLDKNNQERVKLVFNQLSWEVDTLTLYDLLDLTKEPPIDQEKLKVYLLSVAEKIDQPVVEGLFTFDPATKRVSQFKQSQQGQQLDIEKTAVLITLALQDQRPKTITLPVNIIQPKVQTADVNNLGVKELLGEGISRFSGSISNRIYNINLAASRINGVLIPPGKVFSFNNTVGDISAATGYKQAYVIKSGRTVLDDGGGVCQVSTTLFRAVLNSGLPVVARTAHAYRVSYYEQGFPPGLDATVFAPSVDFQFKNDTDSYILIQAYTSGLSLYIDLYGTLDGRTVTLTKPIVTNQTPPPPELRQDDPELPVGVVKQVDWPAWGAYVSFKRTVTRGDETIIDETWRSNYRPWQAVYLVGTKTE